MIVADRDFRHIGVAVAYSGIGGGTTMVRIRRIGAVIVLGTMTVLTVATLSSPAGAVVTGPCSGSVEFSNGVTIRAEQPLDPASVIPAQDSAIYQGLIDIPVPDEPIPFEGGLSAEVAGLGTIPVVGWGGETVEVSASGTYIYEVPSWVPKGTGDILLTASHQQGGAECTGQVKVTIEGDPGAAGIIAATGTVLFGAGVIGAGFKKKGVA